MSAFFGNAVNFVFALIGLAIFIGISVRIFLNMCSKEKNVSAVVVGKECYDRTFFFKSDAPHVKKEYTIIFLIKNRKKAFGVSRISYDTYLINQKGILTYKGDKIIDFKYV